MSSPLKIAFMGTPDFAVPPLKALIDSEHDVVAVYSQPPRPKGRGKKLQSSPVHLCAEENGIPVHTPVNFKDENDVNQFKKLDIDVAIVTAYGLILPKSILEAPKHGCLNIHASILPRWRGAAPIHRAILAGDGETGITIMQMDEGLDTGDTIKIKRTPITEKTTLPALHDDLSEIGAQMIVECINELSENNNLIKTPQPEEGTCYAHMLKKEDGKIDWNNNASYIHRQIRALNPWPGSWCLDQNGKRLKVLKASITDSPQKGDTIGVVLENGAIQCGENSVLSLEIIQPENKNKMRTADAINGGILSIGDVLS